MAALMASGRAVNYACVTESTLNDDKLTVYYPFTHMTVIPIALAITRLLGRQLRHYFFRLLQLHLVSDLSL